MLFADRLRWRRLPHLDFEYDLTAAELTAIYQDEHWLPHLKKLCQLALHPNTPPELLAQLAKEHTDDEFHSLQRCLWLRAQMLNEPADQLPGQVVKEILHQQLRFARVAGQIRQELSGGVAGTAPLDQRQTEEIMAVLETFAVLTNCSIPNPGDMIMIWLVSVAKEAYDFARTDLYYYYLLPDEAVRSFTAWARHLHSQE